MLSDNSVHNPDCRLHTACNTHTNDRVCKSKRSVVDDPLNVSGLKFDELDGAA